MCEKSREGSNPFFPMIKWTVGWKLAVFCSFELFKRWRNMTRLTREELEQIIDENPLRSLSSIGEETGNSRVAIEKWLKTYQLDEYRNRKIKRLRGDKARKRRDYQN
ncbi:hypothetical protein EFN80_08420 [Lactococcus lactis]|nr:hypothetical protein [Lactococcus lactis subsp. lactis]MCT1192986.1 hypothetical protein [Lactococcus lactis]MBR8682634.1 hypothetical protein [Lactococcus lactis subsp. lactis]MBR8687790.1 hypothetical protein [Lactococcus lactis subsp. lactis]MCT0067374.1 hypothetical protein [Lactococcus lactis subsp. lactis]